MRKLAIATVVSFLVLTACAPQKSQTNTGTKAGFPDFTLSSVDGKSVTLSALDAKAVVLDFWYIDCPPCRKAIPELVKLNQKYKDRGVVFIGIDLGDEKSRLDKFIADNNIDYMILMGTNQIAQRNNIVSVPTMYVLDSKRNVVTKEIGFSPDDGLAKIDQALEKLVGKGK